MISFYSILPELNTEKGHIYAYHIALKQAVEKNGWKHFAWAPSSCLLPELPQGWRKNLADSNSGIVSHFKAYLGALRMIARQEKPILFIEHFRLVHLITLCLALAVWRRPFHLWLLHRYEPSRMTRKGQIHAWIYRIFKRYFGNSALQFFTDSVPLGNLQKEWLQASVRVLPIPHSGAQDRVGNEEEDGTYWWWPGEAREEKGGKHISRIASLLKNSPIRLVVCKSALHKGVVEKSQGILVLKEGIPRSEYEQWLHRVDMVLLPYDPEVYRSATSGIFVEAIMAGKLAAVHEGTWMARELRNHCLDELIIDWEDSDVVEKLLALQKNQNVIEKLRLMREAYCKYHSMDSFSQQLQDAAQNL